MDTTFVFPRKLIREFIKMYKDLPCLWNRNCGAYKHKQKRHEAISKLTEFVQESDPTITRVHILRKIESLRSCVRREHKRVIESKLKATDPDDIYVPNLWYYDLFSFLFEEEDNNFKPKNYVVDVEPNNTDSPEEEAASDEDDELLFEQSMESYHPPEFNSNIIEVAESSSKRYQPYEDEKNKRHCTEVDDEYDAIGINVAAKLRTISPNMRILAEKLINDVLFQAQLNGLTSSTVISTPDPFKQDNESIL